MWFLWACKADPEPVSPPAPAPAPAPSAPTVPEPFVTASWSTTERCPAPDPGDCAREADWADWADGRRMQLYTGELRPGQEVLLTVLGALPGDTVSFWRGGACAFDCPVHLDGACFQPIAPVLLGEAVADGTGRADLTITPDTSWGSAWVVLQATAGTYLSQPVLDLLGERTGVFAHGLVPMAPMTVRAQASSSSSGWLAPLGAGQRVQVEHQVIGYDADAQLLFTADAVTETAYGAAGAPEFWSASPSSFALSVVDESEYSFDLGTRALEAPVDWYPDLDCDGYGDPNGVPLSSAIRVVGGSPAASDCDDNDPAWRPHGEETCGDGLDQDCDGEDRPCVGMDLREAGTRLIGPAGSLTGQWLASGDLDGDGVLELVSDGAIFEASRTDQHPQSVIEVGEVYDALVTDLSGDGLGEIVLASWKVELYPAPETAPVLLLEPEVIPPNGWRLGSGDVTGDGQADLILGGGTEASLENTRTAVYAGPITGALSAPEVLLRNRSVGSGVAVADGDGDGLSDVWTHEVCLHLAPLVDAPEGCAGEPDESLASNGLISGDIDGDGLHDVLALSGSAAYGLSGVLSGDLPAHEAAWLTLEYELLAIPAAAVVSRAGEPAELLVSAGGGPLWSISAGGGGTLALEEGTVLGQGADLGLWGADLDSDGLDEAIVSDPNVSVGTEPYTGVVYVSWGL